MTEPGAIQTHSNSEHSEETMHTASAILALFRGWASEARECPEYSNGARLSVSVSAALAVLAIVSQNAYMPKPLALNTTTRG